jgi:hypothetical protein
MPRGGFGNLIALPLQHGPRALGNSVFLDDQLRPYPDDLQWSTPWTQLPSRKRSPVVITEPLPNVVRAVLGQKLFVDKTGLPSPLINQIKRLAAFQNPEFYKKQSMRLSTAMTPRLIACAEDLPQFVALPRGSQSEFEALLRDYRVPVQVEDQRVGGEPLRFQFHGKLTSIQQAAADALLAHDIGVFVAPPGVGKTVVGTYLVAARGCSTGPSLAAARPVAGAVVSVLGFRTETNRSDRSGQEDRQRPARRGDDPKPSPQGQCSRHRCPIRSGHRHVAL